LLSGKHCVQELYNANPEKLNDADFVKQALTQASLVASATLLDVTVHSFPVQGVTGFALLAESHISIHSWPESGYAAVDVFTCGETTDPEQACAFLAEAFEARSQHIITLDRYIPDFIKPVAATCLDRIDTKPHTFCERRTAITV